MSYKDPEDQRRYMKKHYEANKDTYIRRAADWNRKHRDRIRQIVREAKDRPCTDCGVIYPYYVMQFDHLDANTKVNDVASMVRLKGYVSLAKVQAEMDKCEVVCANCHAERTHRRRVAGTGFEPATCEL